MNKRQEFEAMIAGVDRLAALMKKRLRQKRREGYSGGLNPENRHRVVEMLRDHLGHIGGCLHCGADPETEDETFQHAADIANLAMMLGLIDAGSDRRP